MDDHVKNPMMNVTYLTVVAFAVALISALVLFPMQALAVDVAASSGESTDEVHAHANRVSSIDKHCALLIKGNYLVPCTSKGVAVGDAWPDGFDLSFGDTTTLFIAADVTTIGEGIKWRYEDGGEGSCSSLTVGDYSDSNDRPCSRWSTINFLTKEGKNACSNVSGLCFFSHYYKCSSINIINFEKTQVTSLGDTFAYSSISSIVLPSGLKSLGSSAFAGCSRLKSLNLEKTKLTSVSTDAFEDSGLKSITLPSTCKKVRGGAWLGSGKFKVYLTRKGSVSIQGEGALKQSAIKKVKAGPVSKSLMVSWKKVSGASGYEVWISKSKNFSKGTIKTTFKKGKAPYKKCSFTGLTKSKGTKYYVKVRPYIKTWDNLVYYGAWSKVKSGKSKK